MGAQDFLTNLFDIFIFPAALERCVHTRKDNKPCLGKSVRDVGSLTLGSILERADSREVKFLRIPLHTIWIKH